MVLCDIEYRSRWDIYAFNCKNCKISSNLCKFQPCSFEGLLNSSSVILVVFCNHLYNTETEKQTI